MSKELILSESIFASVSIPPIFFPSNIISLGHLILTLSSPIKAFNMSDIFRPKYSVNILNFKISTLGFTPTVKYILPMAGLIQFFPSLPFPSVCSLANTTRGLCEV